jgi:hypothetical protein
MSYAAPQIEEISELNDDKMSELNADSDLNHKMSELDVEVAHISAANKKPTKINEDTMNDMMAQLN